jgi:hypothetical protein
MRLPFGRTVAQWRGPPVSNDPNRPYTMTEPRNLSIDGDRLWTSIMEVAMSNSPL